MLIVEQRHREVHSTAPRDTNYPQAYYYFDVVRYRLPRHLSRSELRFIRDNAKWAWLHPGHYIRGFIDDVLTVIGPKRAALHFLGTLRGAMLNYVEITRDTIVPDADLLHDQFNQHFVQPWHGRSETVFRSHGTTSYSGQPKRKHRFVWYSDLACKITGELECFHLEGRHQGKASVRKAGIHRPRDLLTFDHEAYWAKHLNLFEIDFERLGRLYHNRRSRGRRSNPVTPGSFGYNRDRAAGVVLYNAHAWHSRQLTHSTQRFVDQFGRGPFLRSMTFSQLSHRDTSYI